MSMVSSFVAAKYPGVCDYELPPVMSPVMQATGWRIVLTSVMTPLPVLLRVFRCTTSWHIFYVCRLGAPTGQRTFLSMCGVMMTFSRGGVEPS